MRNLLERVSPQVQEMLDSKKELYPSSIEKIENGIKNVFYVNDVKFGILEDIKIFLGHTSKFEPRSWFLQE
tara:strand:- start:569 stop:781 length:213 start_codon:yes stop_codon:yes gene_type:complete